MDVKKKILDFDTDALFVSSRILEFLIDNALQTILNEDFRIAVRAFREKHDFIHNGDSTHPIESLKSFILICKKAGASNEQFYLIGNKTHELHVLLSSYLNKNVLRLIDWSTELNFLKLSIIDSRDNISIEYELNKIIFIDHKKLVKPLISLLNGFFDRMFFIFFSSKPLGLETKHGFKLTHMITNVSSFDFVKFLSDEEFIYSRIKQFLAEAEEDSITDKIYFFLFRDVKFSIEEIALKLNLSVRSLQRTLKEEGSSFRVIKENVRKELSFRYLQDGSLKMYDVSMLLGYAERGAFEKAFKKWFGKNPSEYRKELA